MSMNPSVFDKRPPFVRFEERELGIDPVATEKEGRPIPRMAVIACITSHGSKDVFEKDAKVWLEEKKRQSLEGAFPTEWYQRFMLQFEEWQKGNELPRDGTPVKTWQMCTREAANRLIATGITTVEDLAEFPDSNLSTIGMDGRYLRDLARGWINEAKDKGANAKALADANVEIQTLKQQNEALAQRVDRLAARLEAGEEAQDTRRLNKSRKGVEAA